MKRTLLLTLLAAVCSGVSFAQIQSVATESFDYPVPGLVYSGSGGAGWVNQWWVSGAANDDIVMFDQSINPPFTIADNVGGYAGQANEFGTAFRQVDLGPHADIVDFNVNPGKIGVDGAVVWISFSTVSYFNGGDHYNGFSTWDAGVGEVLFIGVPWATCEWGIDTQHIGGVGAITVPGTSCQDEVRIVVRIDHLPGDERVQMWLNPSVPHPTGGADLDVMVPDHRWNEVRISSGGSGSGGFWDDIRIEKGDPGSGSIGTSYCGPSVNNSTGGPASITATGSDVALDNNVTLTSSGMPTSQFGYFLNSQTQGLVQPGGSQGFLCVIGQIGRYNANILNSGASGEFSLPLDLPNTPTPSGPTAIVSGETWYFQCWYRDVNPGPTSNFTDGVCITFQ